MRHIISGCVYTVQHPPFSAIQLAKYEDSVRNSVVEQWWKSLCGWNEFCAHFVRNQYRFDFFFFCKGHDWTHHFWSISHEPTQNCIVFVDIVCVCV